MEEMINVLSSYIYDNIVKEGLIITIICYVAGSVLKNAIPKFDNQKIVPTLTLLGAILSLILHPFVNDSIVMGVFKGMVAGWGAVGLHQFGKSLIKSGIIKLRSDEEKTE